MNYCLEICSNITQKNEKSLFFFPVSINSSWEAVFVQYVHDYRANGKPQKQIARLMKTRVKTEWVESFFQSSLLPYFYANFSSNLSSSTSSLAHSSKLHLLCLIVLQTSLSLSISSDPIASSSAIHPSKPSSSLFPSPTPPSIPLSPAQPQWSRG